MPVTRCIGCRNYFAGPGRCPKCGADNSTPQMLRARAHASAGQRPLVGRSGTNGFAIAALVLGLLGISLLALVFGLVALKQIKEDRAQTGRGLALAGIWLAVAWTVLGVVLVVLLASG